MTGTLGTIILLVYWLYGCYIYFKIKPHLNESVAYSSWCREERQRLAYEERMKTIRGVMGTKDDQSGEDPEDGKAMDCDRCPCERC